MAQGNTLHSHTKLREMVVKKLDAALEKQNQLKTPQSLDTDVAVIIEEVVVKKLNTPPDEQDRLKALRSLDILDSLTEERFDRLTRMAKQMFNVPIAMVALVDENRLWFKSRIGLNICEVARNISFCDHAILGNEVFVVADATKDERFANSPLVLNEPNIRFYAGCPLKVMHGYKIGTLCIIDRKPRDFSKENSELLADLAAMAEKELMAVQLATLDEMTSLSNRRGFMAVANKILPLCIRNNIPATLAFLDLNNFKSINDRFGHAEGDNALIAFAQQLEGTFRASDAIARLGGDEFAVLLTGTSKEHARAKMTKLKASIETKNIDANRGYAISFSYGLVDFKPDTHHSIEDLLGQADVLMYEHKMQKRKGSQKGNH